MRRFCYLLSGLCLGAMAGDALAGLGIWRFWPYLDWACITVNHPTERTWWRRIKIQVVYIRDLAENAMDWTLVCLSGGGSLLDTFLSLEFFSYGSFVYLSSNSRCFFLEPWLFFLEVNISHPRAFWKRVVVLVIVCHSV